MGRSQTELQAIFEALDGSPNVYFQPPPNVSMSYPAIVYHRDDIDTKFANNHPYSLTKRYLVTVIDRDPNSSLVDQVASLPLSLFNRNFAAGNLNHDVFVLYF